MTKLNGKVLEQLTAQTQEGVWFIGREARTVDVNPAMCQMLDRKREDVPGRSIFEFVDDTNHRIFERQMNARRDGGGKAIRLTGTAQDITDQVEADRKLRQAQKIEAVEAQSIISSGQPFDLVLSDVVLPNGMSGLAFVNQILPRFPDLKVVFASGYPTLKASPECE